MKSILVYGDSISWGYDPKDGTRYPPEHRWPRVMEEALGDDARVIDECLNGRMVASDSPFMPDRNGRKMLTPLLESHMPIDLVIVMLGTNDKAPIMKLDARDIAGGCGMMIWDILKSQAGPDLGTPQILLVAPPPLGEAAGFMEMFFYIDEAASPTLSELYRRVADDCGCSFFDAGTVVSASEIDGVHLDPESQVALGKAMAKAVRPLLSS
jgi:lysophospholipase L1-like esterase